MYLEASTAARGFSSTAKLVSKKMKAIPSPNVCFLTMWYHMKGTGVGSLEIKKQSDGAFTFLYPTLFSRSGDQGDMWRNVTVDLYTSFYSFYGFTVSIEAVGLYSFSSDIAIDDVIFSPACSQYFVGIQTAQLTFDCSM